jgi:peptidyl-prolyl cis-trans isomerase-like protein 2
VTDPLTGSPIKRSDLVDLHFSRNADDDVVDPVTGKVLTPNTHIVAIGKTGNVFAWDTIERLNIKAKNMHDLVTDDEFSRKDIITLQDPMSVDGKGYKGGEMDSKEEKIAKAKEAAAKAKAQREKGVDAKKASASNGNSKALSVTKPANGSTSTVGKPLPYNAAQHTTGQAAASFTSTYVTPHTSAERAILTEEEYLLVSRRVRQRGFVTMQTSLGELSIELYPEYAPKTVWNFIRLSQKGAYRNLIFHRNIKNFMIQGGDPTGTGRGGDSIWGKNFKDEFDSPLIHDERGVLSMANKGKDTNSSQFFITYRAQKHLDRKHTIFGKVVGGMDTLAKLEAVETDDKSKPLEDITLVDVIVLVDPFEAFLKQREEKEKAEEEKEEIKRQGGAEEDRVTWTGKRIREDGTVIEKEVGGVGRYLADALASKKDSAAKKGSAVSGATGSNGDMDFPAKKKVKSGGFGNFSNW